jgi:hypothetical protein
MLGINGLSLLLFLLIFLKNSAMEAKFYRHKEATHAHTNMAKVHLRRNEKDTHI